MIFSIKHRYNIFLYKILACNFLELLFIEFSYSSLNLWLKETRRKKRKVPFEESDSDSIYACVKVVVGRQAYRSCVPKYSGYVNVTCTSTLGRSVVCYCETDECNKASFLDVFFRPWILILALLFVTLI